MLPDPVTDLTCCQLYHMGQQKVHRQLWFVAKHQQEGGLACVLVGCGVIAKTQLLEIVWPLVFLLSRQCAKESMEGSVKVLTLAITLRMIWGGPGLFDAVQVTQLVDYCALKIVTLIRVQPSCNVLITEKAVKLTVIQTSGSD